MQLMRHGGATCLSTCGGAPMPSSGFTLLNLLSFVQLNEHRDRGRHCDICNTTTLRNDPRT